MLQCFKCGNNGMTVVTSEIGMLAWVLFAIMLIIGFWPCACIPFCMAACKDYKHSCAKCGTVVATKSSL